jgi:hypothetical protein
MTVDAEAAGSERMARAHAACQSTVDDARGTMHEIIGEALAAGIECLRRADGTLDSDEIVRFLAAEHASEISDVVDRLAGADAEGLAAVLLEAVEDVDDIEDSLAEVIGPVERLGGYDSTRFAMMTAGRMDIWAIRRGDRYLTFRTGDSEEGGANYDLRDCGSLADDPQLREARLALADELGGLGRGISIEGEEELSDELRDLTISGRGQWPECWQETLRREDLADMIEENLESFVDSTGLPEPDARRRLAELFEIGTPKDDVERDLIWEMWLTIRPT